MELDCCIHDNMFKMQHFITSIFSEFVAESLGGGNYGNYFFVQGVAHLLWEMLLKTPVSQASIRNRCYQGLLY